MTSEPAVRFPVTCPECRQEVLTVLPIGVVAAALIARRPVRLHASCHDVYWDAHRLEIDQLREYLALLSQGVQADEQDANTAISPNSAS